MYRNELAGGARIDEIQRQVAKRHGDDRIEGIRVTAANQIAESLADRVDPAALVEPRRQSFERVGHSVSDSTKLAVTKLVRLLRLERHRVIPRHLGALGYEDHRVVAGVSVPVVDEELGEVLDVEAMLWNDATIGRARHRRQKCGVPGVAPEHLDHEEAFVRTGRSPELVSELDGPGHASAEPDAVVRPRNIVVHRLGNRDHRYASLVQLRSIAERIVAADRNQIVDAEEVEIGEYLIGDVVDFVLILVSEVGGHQRLGQVTRARSGAVQERAPGPPRPVDDVFGQDGRVLAVVGVLVRDDIHQTGPTPADSNDTMSLSQCANGDGSNGRIEARHVAAPS